MTRHGSTTLHLKPRNRQREDRSGANMTSGVMTFQQQKFYFVLAVKLPVTIFSHQLSLSLLSHIAPSVMQGIRIHIEYISIINFH